MPRRRTSVDPKRETDVLRDEIRSLRSEITQMKQPGASFIQTDNWEKAIDPFQGQIVLHHPGTHMLATPESPVTYYHDHLWRQLGPISTPSVVFHRISTTGLNNVVVNSAPCILTGYYITNVAGVFKYVKLFDKASAPTMGTDIPKITLGIPGVTAANIGLDNPINFVNGIAIGCTTGIDDLDVAQVNIRELAINIYYQ